MRLRKIEMQGFKSFADKVEINFKDGITAIVGPNGSGKSNISDAIRWVLGEQSVKNLRGSKMEDIIFSGTSRRKALGYTEITITFDNKAGNIPVDYEEVAITRRMFRSGESEYYLNKNSCRLKDIRELFMDTGVGKDGYSIIGQGRIEEILSNRPEDRRNIFEEAAGIVKYKVKKEEAERKLEKTENNIIRIKDLVFELSNQSKILEEQAYKANCFSELFNELKDIEVNLFLRDIKEANDEIDKINKEILALEKDLRFKLREQENIEESFNLLKDNSQDMDIKIQESRDSEILTINKLDKYKNKINILEEQETFYNKDLERVKVEENKLKLRLEELVEADSIIEKEIAKGREEYNLLLSDYNFKIIELEEKLRNLKNKEDIIENKKNNIVKLYNTSSDRRSELNSIVSFNENIEKRILQLRKEINKMTIEEESNRKQYEGFSKDENKMKDEISLLREKLIDLESIESDNRSMESSINKKINSNNLDLQSRISNLKLFKNMEEGYEGYYKGVRSILKRSKVDSNLQRGIIGIIADLIIVEEKFEKSIDVALGSNTQNLVTETEEDAKKAIEYLKSNRLGKITCLPLSVIRGNTLNFNMTERETFKILGLGSEVIKYDDKFANIFKYLLGRTVIVENIDYGIKLANKYNHSYRIVTLDGEVLNPGGSMTGGSHANNSISIINRKNRIRKLEIETKELKENQENLSKEKNILMEKIESNKNQLIELNNSIRNLEYSIMDTVNNKNNYQQESSRLKVSIEKAEDEITTLNKESSNYKIKQDELKSLLIELEQESLELKKKIEELISLYNLEKQERDEMDKKVTDMKINLNTQDGKVQNFKQKLNDDRIEISKIKLELKEREDTILSNRLEIEKIIQNKEDLKKKVEKLDNDKIEVEKELEELISNRKRIMEKFYQEQENLKYINKSITDIGERKKQEEVKLAKTSVKLENYYKKMEDDYELTYEEALKYEREIIDIKRTIIESRKLKVKIKELGTVNLSSIEEHKRIKTRLDFILGQQDDLINAKSDLKNVIKDMEDKMGKQFIVSFEEINKNFQDIFKILFNGGKAELILEDKEDLLNTGIEIKAQPPGKRLQSLSLLSGGEKSLTAVALLFSILKMKPAPFCVLDEIDAALDEANIGRYTNYLKEFCRETQFIMITHRKTTMEMADVLYGVTMEEEGISKLISVELKDNMDIIAS